MGHIYKGQECLNCPYCGKREYVPVPALHLGRCACGGRRAFDAHNDTNVACLTCGKVSERLTARVRDEQERGHYVRQEMAEHIERGHRSRVILDRIASIEHDARYYMRTDSLTDADWQTHPLAVEYRALLCEWWQLPSVSFDDYLHSPTRNRSLTAKGSSNATGSDWLMTGRRKLLKQAATTGERRFNVGQTEYRLWFDEPTEGAA